MDGASRVQTFFFVTLPMMTPTMFFASVITFIGAFQIFDPVQIITQGGPNDSTITAVMYLYQTGFQAFQIGYASTDRPGRLRGDHAGHPAAVLGIAEVGAQRMTTTSALPAPRGRRPRPPAAFRLGRLIKGIVLFVIGVLMIAPLVWMIATSLTEPIAAFDLPPNWIPVPFSLQNFGDVVDLIPIGRQALNSLIVTTISVVGSLLTASLAAYAFSRIPFRGRDSVFVVLLAALMVPTQLTIIPIFIIMRKLELIDTLAALWIPALVNVFAIFFLRQYFNTIPRDLDEAARIDGAGHLRILFQILLPLAGPALSALAILGFEASWNNYFGPLIFLSSPEKMTLPVGLVSLSAGQGGGPAVVVFAGITLVVVPILIVFLFFQRQFVESVASVGIRG